MSNPVQRSHCIPFLLIFNQSFIIYDSKISLFMPILDNLLIRGIKTTEDSCISSLLLKAKVEAMAILGHHLMFLVDQRRQTFTSFNYNPDLYPLFGSNPYVLKLDKIKNLINPLDHALLVKYIQLINTQFTNKNKHTDQYIYFTIKHAFDVHKVPQGACIKILPFLYDSQNNLLATLAIIEPISYAGGAVLKKHYTNENKTDVYNVSTKRFIPEESTQLSDIECKIIQLSGIGVKEKNIAKQLDLTLPGLKRIKTNIFEKLKVNSISEAIFVAYKRKYID